MTKEELRAAAGQLVNLHRRFAPHFGRKEPQEHSLEYLQGLLAGQGRKSVEPIALLFGKPSEEGISQKQVVALQRFLTFSPWQATAVHKELQAVFAEKLMPSVADWPLGVVGVLDESAMVKKGSKSAGVSRQYCGRLGKVENCQVGVYLVGVTPAGTALLDQQLFLPKKWAGDKNRRQEAHVPKEIKFRTKPQIGVALLRRILSNRLVTFDGITADDLYGRSGEFLDELEALNMRYLVEVPCHTTVRIVGPNGKVRVDRSPAGRARWVKKVAARLPPEAWQALQLREGAQGPLVFEFARLRVETVRHRQRGPVRWLVIRRSLEAKPEIKYYLSNAAAEMPLNPMALVTGTRMRVEEFFEEGKSYLGMAQYEARAWSSWHHHMSLVALAHLFVTLTRMTLRKNTSELTLDMAIRLLRASLPQPKLSMEAAIAIVKYHITRNGTAKKSHRKIWEKNHKKIKYKVLL